MKIIMRNSNNNDSNVMATMALINAINQQMAWWNDINEMRNKRDSMKRRNDISDNDQWPSNDRY